MRACRRALEALFNGRSDQDRPTPVTGARIGASALTGALMMTLLMASTTVTVNASEADSVAASEAAVEASTFAEATVQWPSAMPGSYPSTRALVGAQTAPSAGLGGSNLSLRGTRHSVAEPAVSRFALEFGADAMTRSAGSAAVFEGDETTWQSLEGRLDFRPSSFSSTTGPVYGLGWGARLSLYEARERSAMATESRRQGSTLSLGPSFESGRLRSDLSVGFRQEWSSETRDVLAPFGGRLARFGSAGFIDLEGRYALRDGRELRLGVFYDAPEWIAPGGEDSSETTSSEARYGLRMGVSF
ncbi:MAG: hypothetical protein ACK4IT_08570 [Thioalkalivibrionaceae bacterium]